MAKTKLTEILHKQNIQYTEIGKWGKYLRGVWEKEFAGAISIDEKRKIYLHDYLWHLFSYRKAKACEKDHAKNTFNNESKNRVYVFYQHSDYALTIENAKNIVAEDFNYEDDIYIVDTEFEWTYVNTHESACGPYFYHKNNNIRITNG